MLRREPESHDIVQDAYLKLWENRKKVEFEKAGSWLYTTSYRLVLNYVKRERRNERLGEYEVAAHNGKDHPMEIKEILDLGLSKLPPLQRSIVLLRDLEGYNYQEIGDILELSESQVKVYLFRGRKKLKSMLKNIYTLT